MYFVYVHAPSLLVRIGYSYNSLFVERFVFTLISFMAPSLLFFDPLLAFLKKEGMKF